MNPRIAALVGCLAAVSVLPSPVRAATDEVRVGSFYFDDTPSGDGQVVITQGDRITFGFDGDMQHNATVDGMFDSGPKSPGQTYTTGPLTRAGTFTLYCQVHGAAQHSARLVIRAAAKPSASPTKARPSPSRSASRVPSPRPTGSAVQRPSPSPSGPALSPSTGPVPSSSSTPTASASSSPSPTAHPALTAGPDSDVALGAPSPATSPSPAADLVRARPLDDGGIDWQLPALLVLILGLGAGAIAAGRRRRTD